LHICEAFFMIAENKIVHNLIRFISQVQTPMFISSSFL
jgi:hypothetical protein